MKKIVAMLFVIASVSSAFAAEVKASPTPAADLAPGRYAAELDDTYPAFFAISQWPASPVLTGLRLTIPFSTRQEMVTGIDIGLWARCRDYEGIQLNIIRNDVKDTLAGFQVGLYNTANRADLFGIQVGLLNETQSFRGLQAGLVNITGDGDGFMVGIVNSSETLHGYQLGIINVIRTAEVPFFPVFNIGF